MIKEANDKDCGKNEFKKRKTNLENKEQEQEKEKLITTTIQYFVRLTCEITH